MQYNNSMEKIVYILRQCTCHYTIIYHRVQDILKINIISQSSSINVQSLAGIAIVVLTRSSYAGLAVRIH